MPALLTIYAAARMLDISFDEVYELVKAGAIEARGPERDQLISEPSLLAYAQREGIILSPYFPTTL